MAKIKTYRIIKEFTSYSKKKGAHDKRIILHKDIATIEEAKSLVLKEHPEAIFKFIEWRKCLCATNIGGLIYKSVIEIR